MLSALALVIGGVTLVKSLPLVPSFEAQVASALGCRNDQSLLLLKLESDGQVRWPDGHLCSIQESALMMLAWNRDHPDSALALVAPPDTAMALTYPLLNAAEELGIRRAVFALPQNGAAPTQLHPTQ